MAINFIYGVCVGILIGILFWQIRFDYLYMDCKCEVDDCLHCGGCGWEHNDLQ